MRVSYLGPPGTYTEKAAERYSNDTEPVTSLEAVAKSLKIRRADQGVMAYYNYLDGLVQRTLDVIFENDLRIVGATRVPIHLALGCHPKKVDQCTVYSHEKALAQCSEYLARYPGIQQERVQSTAAAADLVKRTRSGLAIADIGTLQKRGLDIIEEEVANKRNGKPNYTDFFQVVRWQDEISVTEEGKEYWTMLAVMPHSDQVGLLHDMTGPFKLHGINIKKIHSRPSLVDAGDEPQMFYLELDTEPSSRSFRRAMELVTHHLNPDEKDVEVARVLGSYEKPDLN